MNCFEWQSRSSDYLDCTLIGPSKREADEHLERCKDCSERYKHYRVILSTLANQPRSVLPVPIRKAPFTAVLPKANVKRLSRERWARVPWYIRSTVEGVTVVALILGGVSVAPRIRSLYEQSIERSLGEFTEPLDGPAGPVAHAQAPGTPYAPGLPVSYAGPYSVEYAGSGGLENQVQADDFASENESDHEEETKPAVHAGKSEIWRFNLKTDSPQDLRAKVLTIFTELQLPPNPGVEAPGGIQFDINVPQDSVGDLKGRLEKIAHAPTGTTGEAFTWYKSKSRTGLPSGKTRVVIWLSQL